MVVPKTTRRKHLTVTRPSTEMDILENPKEWLKNFQQGWLSHLEKTGQLDWKQYVRPRNQHTPSGPGIELSNSRLLLISTAGGYLHESQESYDESSNFGDYSIRVFPANTPFEDISFAHTHYDHQFVDADPQVLLPLRHLEDMVSEGIIGELAPNVISFSGYHPNAIRVVKELIPAILKVAKEDEVNAALLVPA